MISVRLPGIEAFQLHVHDKPDRFISAELRSCGVWEPFESRVALAMLDPGEGFVDLGANLGYYAVLAAARVGPRGRVFAFEPDPEADGDKRDAIVRMRIEIALEQLIRLREGQFRFSLTEKTPVKIGSRDISHELLREGFNAQGLLLDLARGIDEDRRSTASALEASFAQAPDDTLPLGPLPGNEVEPVEQVEEADLGPLPEELTSLGADEVSAATEPHMMAGGGAPGAAPEEPAAILLVDDEADVRQVLVECFTAAGHQVIEAEDPDAALKKASRLGKAGVRFLLVCDLGMPTSGGRSFQGGFEIVKRLMKMHLKPPVLLMAERVSPALQARAKQLGITQVVFKPGLSKLDPDQFRSDLRAFAGRLNRDILPELATKAVPAPPKVPKRREAPPPGAVAEGGESEREIALLQERLDELRRQVDPTQISLMVMRTAREFFERGILLLIKDSEARGLAAFGPAPRGENISLVVREVAIPLAEPSAFSEAMSRRKVLLSVPPEGRWMAHLYGKIGRFQATTGSILPLLAHRETIALLFGDNPETGREVKRVDVLALFVDQAGLALENLFLQRKVKTLEAGAHP